MERTGEQVVVLEKDNPAFRERHLESSAMGELLCPNIFFVGHLKGVGKACPQTVLARPSGAKMFLDESLRCEMWDHHCLDENESKINYSRSPG